MNLHDFASNFYNLIKLAELHAPPAMVKNIGEKLNQIVHKWSQLKNRTELKETFEVDVDLSGMPDKYNKIIKIVSPLFKKLNVNVTIYATGKSKNTGNMLLGNFKSIGFQININIYLPVDSGWAQWLNHRDELVNDTIHHELGHMMQFFRAIYELSSNPNLTSVSYPSSKRKRTDMVDSPGTYQEAQYLKDVEFETYYMDSLNEFKKLINIMWPGKTKQQKVKDVFDFVGLPRPNSKTHPFFDTLYRLDKSKYRLAVKGFTQKFKSEINK